MAPHEALVGYVVRRFGQWQLVKAVKVDERGRICLSVSDVKVPKSAPLQPELFDR
jgi:hypothetical protein